MFINANKPPVGWRWATVGDRRKGAMYLTRTGSVVPTDASGCFTATSPFVDSYGIPYGYIVDDFHKEAQVSPDKQETKTMNKVEMAAMLCRLERTLYPWEPTGDIVRGKPCAWVRRNGVKTVVGKVTALGSDPVLGYTYFHIRKDSGTTSGMGDPFEMGQINVTNPKYSEENAIADAKKEVDVVLGKNGYREMTDEAPATIREEQFNIRFSVQGEIGREVVRERIVSVLNKITNTDREDCGVLSFRVPL